MKVINVKVKKFFLDTPDVDTDFQPYGRDLVKEYIKDKYGRDYSCSVGTYTRMKLKTCIKDFAKVKGLPFDYSNRITKDIDDQIEYSWQDLLEYASKSKALFKYI
jgi:DNA polymerase-3 subunit alpha